MDTVLEQFAGLVHKRLEGLTTCLVAGRDDLDHGYDPVAADVPNGNRAGFATIELDFCLRCEPCLWTSLERGGRCHAAPSRLVVLDRPLILQGKHVRPETSGLLFRQ